MMAIKDLKKQPNIGWNDFLNHLGAKTDSIDVGQPAYYEKLNTLLRPFLWLTEIIFKSQCYRRIRNRLK
jgi:hypothetical protein